MGWERSWTSENARREREGRGLEHRRLPGREIGKSLALFHTEAYTYACNECQVFIYLCMAAWHLRGLCVLTNA